MKTEIKPPDVPIPGYETGYPSPTRRLGKAWAFAWTKLTSADGEFLDGTELAAVAARKAGLEASTIISFLTRAATAGVLEREHRTVAGKRGPRRRTFYRVPQP